jgi:Putative DNA-binding domain
VLHDHQNWGEDRFSGALIDTSLQAPSGITSHNGGPITKRFSVYRNNVAHGLITAYGDIFPAVKAQCGQARFNDVARLCIAANPPRSKMVFEAGREFADFLDGFAPAREQMPWLADLARLERFWLDAWHAADAAPLAPETLSQIPPENWGNLRLQQHPAAFVISSEFAICDLYEDGKAGQQTEHPQTPQNALITRPSLSVTVQRLSLGEASFFNALFSGVTLAEALEAGAAHDDFDVGQALTLMLQSGAFAAIEPIQKA